MGSIVDYKENFKFALASDDGADYEASGKNKKMGQQRQVIPQRCDPFLEYFALLMVGYQP
jgi:hypothetical protein